MKTSTMKAAALIAVASLVGGAAFTIGATRAEAAIDNSLPHMTVHYGDLNLHSNKGAQELYFRVHRAAQYVCGDAEWDPLYIEMWRADHQCEQTALKRAVAQVDSPKLTSIYKQHFPGGRVSVEAPAKSTNG
jgi:UrcA family protein